MELWACGFNAFRQLQCDQDKDVVLDPGDLHIFRCILKDESIEISRTSLSSILSKLSKSVHTYQSRRA